MNEIEENIEYKIKTGEDKPKIKGNFIFNLYIDDSNNSINISYVAETDKIKEYFSKQIQKVYFNYDVLSEVIKSQKKLLDYNGFYNAFLLRQIEEDEFIRIAEEFVTNYKEIDIHILRKKIEFLLEITKLNFTVSELSELFKCNYENISNAMNLIYSNRSIKAIKDHLVIDRNARTGSD